MTVNLLSMSCQGIDGVINPSENPVWAVEQAKWVQGRGRTPGPGGVWQVVVDIAQITWGRRGVTVVVTTPWVYQTILIRDALCYTYQEFYLKWACHASYPCLDYYYSCGAIYLCLVYSHWIAFR
jgi:hypothetical protein